MKNLFHSFQFRVTAAMIASMVVLSMINTALDYSFTFKSHFKTERVLLKNLANVAAITIDAQQLMSIPLNKEGINTEAHQNISGQLNHIRSVNPQIEDVYILTPTTQKNTWKFIVDLQEVKPDGTIVPPSDPGLDYDAGRFSEMLNGLKEPAADDKLETDEYGTTLSGYAPIKDASGKAVAVLGIDVDAANIMAMKHQVFKDSVVFLIISILLAILLATLISQRVVKPVQQLRTMVGYIKNGQWSHRVNIPGKDEISELANSFNSMARSIKHYQYRLQHHFFNAAKSMTMIIEAKDRYTLGHSQSVVNYSEKIALRMGIDPELIEYFKIVALLHDIGKVGIKDSVLTKTGKLDQEEFEMIKQHPVVGEEILKPILDDPLMRSVIRNHHERQDGKGYPDGWKGNQIPLLVCIVTVADSYDAMTSDRAYRKAMSQEDAINELIKHKGTQFHPEVVDIFLEILKEKTV